MKSLLIVLLLTGFAYAGGYHSTPIPGPQGPQGSQGERGESGLSGRDGTNGQDAETHVDVVGGVDVRVLDTRHVSFHLFDDYNLRDGRNGSVGARVVFKLGSSHEERQIAKVNSDIAQMWDYFTDRIAEKDAMIQELRSYAHRPGVHQENAYPEFQKNNQDFWLEKRK